MKYEVVKSLAGKPKVKYQCEHCWTSLVSKLTDAGNRDFCPECRKPYTVPGEEERAEYQATLDQKAAEKAAAAAFAQKTRAQAAAIKTERKVVPRKPQTQAQIDSVAESVKEILLGLLRTCVIVFCILGLIGCMIPGESEAGVLTQIKFTMLLSLLWFIILGYEISGRIWKNGEKLDRTNELLAMLLDKEGTEES